MTICIFIIVLQSMRVACPLLHRSLINPWLNSSEVKGRTRICECHITFPTVFTRGIWGLDTLPPLLVAFSIRQFKINNLIYGFEFDRITFFSDHLPASDDELCMRSC